MWKIFGKTVNGKEGSAAQRCSHGKEERGAVRRKEEEEGFPHEGHAACGGEGLLLRAESLFPGEDSSEKLPPSKLWVLILPYPCPGYIYKEYNI